MVNAKIQCIRCKEWFTPKGIIRYEKDFYCIGCYVWHKEISNEIANEIIDSHLKQLQDEVDKIFECER